MENLSLEDQQGGAQGQPSHHGQAHMGPGPGVGPTLGVPPPQQNQQLPPQMFTTAAQLLDMTDSKDAFALALTSCAVGEKGMVGAEAKELG
jgi:U6 snRNA-associated Sm-like protein LSm1